MKIISILLLIGLIGCANKPPVEISSIDYEIQKVETAVSQIPKWY